MIRRWSGLAVVALLLMLAATDGSSTAQAQVQQGATLTVLRGQVAVVHSDGSAVQPAPSGTIVNVGDEIRTLGNTGALITFFAGTEIELAENTVLAVNEISRQGDRIDISLRQVLGASISRVQTLTESGSSYRIEAGGAVALVRGTEFALIGPITTGAGDIVILACLADCGPTSTFAGCPLQPFLGYGVVVERGKLESGCMPFAVTRGANLLSVAFGAVTTIEQQIQGDTRGVPAGQVAPGQRQEASARRDQQQRDEQTDHATPTPSTPTPTPSTPTLTPSTPTPTPSTTPCDTATNSGGVGVTRTVHSLGRTSGTFPFSYQAFSIPDRFEVIYEGRTLLDTGSVSGGATQNLTYTGSATVITVVVTGPSGTLWNYTVGCPT